MLRFVFTILCFTGGSLALIGIFSYSNNYYGLFGRRGHSSNPIHANERTSKYLLAARYVPENFDGLLLGTCITSPLNTALTPKPRIYNGSIRGSNMTDMLQMAKLALAQKKLKLLLLDVGTHAFEQAPFAAPTVYSAELAGLGSIDLFANVALKLAKKGPIIDAFGVPTTSVLFPRSQFLENLKSRIKLIRAEKKKDSPVFIDPNTWNDYTTLLSLAHESGVQVVAIFPPIYHSIYALDRERLVQFKTRVRKELNPKDSVLDFNEGELSYLSKNQKHFNSDDALSPAGADQVQGAINQLLTQQLNGISKPSSNGVPIVEGATLGTLLWDEAPSVALAGDIELNDSLKWFPGKRASRVDLALMCDEFEQCDVKFSLSLRARSKYEKSIRMVFTGHSHLNKNSFQFESLDGYYRYLPRETLSCLKEDGVPLMYNGVGAYCPNLEFLAKTVSSDLERNFHSKKQWDWKKLKPN